MKDQFLIRQRIFESSRVVALTAYTTEEHRARSKAAGCELHLEKPVSAQALFDILDLPTPRS